jgi:hypothetical protein
MVLTFDISPDTIHSRLTPLPNVLYKTIDCNLLDPAFLSKVDVIFLDISHNGADERLFLDRIEPHFKGILVMDDIDGPDAFPELTDFFNDLKREKHTLNNKGPYKIGAAYGTGVIPYGDWTVEIKEHEDN